MSVRPAALYPADRRFYRSQPLAARIVGSTYDPSSKDAPFQTVDVGYSRDDLRAELHRPARGKNVDGVEVLDDLRFDNRDRRRGQDYAHVPPQRSTATALFLFCRRSFGESRAGHNKLAVEPQQKNVSSAPTPMIWGGSSELRASVAEERAS